jgi:hypothetical protein
MDVNKDLVLQIKLRNNDRNWFTNEYSLLEFRLNTVKQILENNIFPIKVAIIDIPKISSKNSFCIFINLAKRFILFIKRGYQSLGYKKPAEIYFH